MHRHAQGKPNLKENQDPHCVWTAHRIWGSQWYIAECQELDVFDIPCYHMVREHWQFWESALTILGTRTLFFFLFFPPVILLSGFKHKHMFSLWGVSLCSPGNIHPIWRSEKGGKSSVLSPSVTLICTLFCK